MRLLLTGADGFTGRHFSDAAVAAGYSVFSLTADLTDRLAVSNEVARIAPTHVVHLAAISSVTHADELAFYQVNLFGALNLLEALRRLPVPPVKVLLASSANVYGNQVGAAISETDCPKPVNHYAISKLAMEHMAMTFADCLPLLITRPFNYTGVGHDQRFVIPKIVDHFVRKARYIELGNVHVLREYNDVRMVCDAMLKLLASGVSGEIYNICTGYSYSLKEVIERVQEISGHTIDVRINPDFVRENDVSCLAGDPSKVISVIGDLKKFSLNETLTWMVRRA